MNEELILILSALSLKQHRLLSCSEHHQYVESRSNRCQWKEHWLAKHGLFISRTTSMTMLLNLSLYFMVTDYVVCDGLKVPKTHDAFDEDRHFSSKSIPFWKPFISTLFCSLMKNHTPLSSSSSSNYPIHDRLTATIAPQTNTTLTLITNTNNTNACPTAHATPQPQHQDLVSLFECPVCFDYALPPILQCQAGHFVCAQCRQKLSSCPTCRGPLGNIRNLAIEKVADTILFPCKYQSNGCQLSLMHKNKLEHEDTCDFRPVGFAEMGSSSSIDRSYLLSLVPLSLPRCFL